MVIFSKVFYSQNDILLKENSKGLLQVAQKVLSNLLKWKVFVFLIFLQRNQGISSLAWPPTQVVHYIHLYSEW